MTGKGRLWGALALGLGACTRAREAPRGNDPASAPASASAASSATVDDEPDSPAVLEAAVPPVVAGPWREAVVREDWAAARGRIEALPEAEKNTPPMRFLRARVAFATGDAAGAVRALAGLEASLPLLSRRVAQLRAEAEIEAGPFDEAAVYFGAQPTARGQLRAAKAYERAGKTDDARRALDAAVARGGKDEPEARAMRARLAEAAGARDLALADAKWVVKNAPSGAYDAPARAALARLDPSFSLTPAEHLARAEKFADAGKTDEALAELDASLPDPSARQTPEARRARGRLLFKLRRWQAAADALSSSSASGGPEAPEDAYLAARSLSRADRDDEAIAAYRAVAKKYPQSPFADDASYMAARLELLLARSAVAEAALGEYTKKFPKGRHRDEALYDGALAALDVGKASSARASFATLAAPEKGLDAARLRELEGVAAARAGDRPGAERALREAIRLQPLSFPALAARARLREMHADLPPLVEPPDAAAAEPPALAIALPAPAELLRQLGLLSDAEEALHVNDKAFQKTYAPRGVEALCRAYAGLGRAARSFRVGQDNVRAETLVHAPTPATRWAWECLYPTPFADHVTAAEARERLPVGIVDAVMRQESAFQPEVVSGAHAVGLLQLLPSTARELATRAGLPFDPATLTRPAVNVDLGARYIARLLTTWKGSVPLAVASYNAGPKAVSRWVERWGGKGVDVWAARIPYSETRNYVLRVVGNWARYAYLAGGEGAVPELDLEVDPSLRAEPDAF